MFNYSLYCKLGNCIAIIVWVCYSCFSRRVFENIRIEILYRASKIIKKKLLNTNLKFMNKKTLNRMESSRTFDSINRRVFYCKNIQTLSLLKLFCYNIALNFYYRPIKTESVNFTDFQFSKPSWLHTTENKENIKDFGFSHNQ